MKTKVTKENINKIAEGIAEIVNDAFPDILQENEPWDKVINPFIDNLISANYDIRGHTVELDELIGVELENLQFGTHY